MFLGRPVERLEVLDCGKRQWRLLAVLVRGGRGEDVVSCLGAWAGIPICPLWRLAAKEDSVSVRGELLADFVVESHC